MTALDDIKMCVIFNFSTEQRTLFICIEVHRCIEASILITELYTINYCQN